MHHKIIRLFPIAAIALLCLAGCSNDENGETMKKSPVVTLPETNMETSEGSVNARIELPEKYEKNDEKVQFNCEIDVPKGFDTSVIHKAKVKRVYCSDHNKTLEIFGENKTKIEEHITPADGDVPEEYYYSFSDGSILNTGNSMTFMTENSQHYNGGFWRLGEERLEKNQEKLAFAASQDCIVQVEKVMSNIGYQAEVEFESYSLEADMAKEWEEHLTQDGGYDQELYKQDWSKEDDAYLLYAYQNFQGLPVYHELMFLGGNMKYVNADNAPVQAIYTAQGIESLRITYLYQFLEEEESVSLKTFEEIVETVNEKLNSLLSESVYEVKYAKLVEMVKHNQGQEYDVIPVWYFEVESEEGSLVVLVDAATAEEVFVK